MALLDTISATAYRAGSVSRLLRAAYAGAAIRVERSSDSTQQDIGFSGGLLDSASLLAFVGAGSGYLRKLYDQSGNARDWIHFYGDIQIVVAGVLQTLGGFPALHCNAGSSAYSAGAVTAGDKIALGVVHAFSTIGAFDDQCVWEDAYGSLGFGLNNNQPDLVAWGAQRVGQGTTVLSSNVMRIGGAFYDLTNYAFYKDGAVDGSGVNALSSPWPAAVQGGIGARFGNTASYIAEVVEFYSATALSSGDRTALYGGQSAFYAPVAPTAASPLILPPMRRIEHLLRR